MNGRVGSGAGSRRTGRDVAWVAVSIVNAVVIVAIFVALRRWFELGVVLYDLHGAGVVVTVLAGVRLHRPARPAPWLLLAAGGTALLVGNVVQHATTPTGRHVLAGLVVSGLLQPVVSLGALAAILLFVRGSGERGRPPGTAGR